MAAMGSTNLPDDYSLTESEKATLVNRLVAEYSSFEKRGTMSESDSFLFFCAHKNPLLCWEIITRVFHATTNRNALCYLACGPLEDLLASNGDKIITQIEKLAQQNIAFRRVLSGVYKNAMTDEVWNRVCKIALDDGFFTSEDDSP